MKSRKITPNSSPVDAPCSSSADVFRLTKIRLFLLYILIPSLFFSFYPVISLGADESTNFELSLPLILLCLYSLLSLPALINHFPRRITPLLFLVFVLISVFWSANPLRTVLSSGIITCLVVSILTIPELISSQKIKQNIVKISLFSTILVCVFCWLQCLLDVLGVNNEHSLLCPGCTSYSLGFPHPNGFAIEPQFMGNLLLAPAILSLFALCKKFNLKTALFSIFVISTLFIVFSRGAIYAFLLASAGLIIYKFIKKQPKNSLIMASCVVIAFIIGIISQGVLAAVSPTSDTFKTGIGKSISQLSLGRIEIFSSAREELLKDAYENSEIISDVVITDDAFSGNSTTALFSGYITESTDQRIELNNFALDLWNDSLSNLIFGVGLGSAGPRLYEKFPELGHPKEIVQNEYISLLLETGLIGVTLAVLMLCGYSKLILYYAKKLTPQLIALVVAYGITLLFFSGLPNALHIYLLPIIVALLFPGDNLISKPTIRRTGRH